MMNFKATSSQVQTLVKHASQDGVCISHCYYLEGVLVEGMMQLPKAPSGFFPQRDIRIIRSPGEVTFSVSSLTELGDIFIAICLPEAA